MQVAAGPGGKAAGDPSNHSLSKTDSALANLRARALDLHGRMLELRDAVAMLRDGMGSAANAPWGDFLSQYQTLGKLFHQLTEELDRAVTDVGFQNFVLQPCAVSDDPELLPNMLRTRLEPEVEQDLVSRQTQFLREQAAEQSSEQATEPSAPDHAAAPAPHDAMGAAPPPLNDAQKAQLEKRILMFNAFVYGALDRLEDTRERVMSDSRPQEKQLRETTQRAQTILTSMTNGNPIS